MVDLARAEEATLESRKRKRNSKEIHETAFRTKTKWHKKNPNGNQFVPPEVPEQAAAPTEAGKTAPVPEMPEQASAPRSAGISPSEEPPTPPPAAATAAPAQKEGALEERKGDGREFQVLSLPSAETRGHTGYLTFARRLLNPLEDGGLAQMQNA